MEEIKKALPPFWTGSTIFAKQPNKLYSKEKVKSMMEELVEYVDKHWLQNEFEARLNDKGMNNNNNENEDLYPEFLDDMINSFIN